MFSRRGAEYAKQQINKNNTVFTDKYMTPLRSLRESISIAFSISPVPAILTKNHSYLVFSFFASFALFADNIVPVCVHLCLI
jgi:hypothetical protein